METRVSRPGKDGSFFYLLTVFSERPCVHIRETPDTAQGYRNVLSRQSPAGKFPEKFLKRGGIGYGRDTMSNVQHDREISI